LTILEAFMPTYTSGTAGASGADSMAHAACVSRATEGGGGNISRCCSHSRQQRGAVVGSA
jgi:hypothetical protein